MFSSYRLKVVQLFSDLFDNLYIMVEIWLFVLFIKLKHNFTLCFGYQNVYSMCKLQSILSSNSVQKCGGVNIRCLKLFQCSRSRSKNTPVRSVPVHCPLFLLATKKTDRQFHRPLVAVTSFIRSGHSHGRSRWYCEAWSAPSCFSHVL